MDHQFQNLFQTTKLINASTHTIKGVVLSSPMGRHSINVEPLGVVDVPVQWVEKGLDYRGNKVVKSTIEQHLPLLVDPKHPNVAKAKAAVAANEKIEAENAKKDYSEWKPLIEFPAPPPKPEPAVVVTPQQSGR